MATPYDATLHQDSYSDYLAATGMPEEIYLAQKQHSAARELFGKHVERVCGLSLLELPDTPEIDSAVEMIKDMMENSPPNTWDKGMEAFNFEWILEASE